jgi:hypothetical protein
MAREDAVAIVNQEFVSVFAPDGLTQLLQRPGGTRMRRDVAMDKTTAAMLDHHEHVQQPKRRGDGDKEIAGNESLGVQAQEGRPAQVASRPTSREPGQILAHCPWRHPNLKLQEQLIGNALLTPQGILVCDPANQGLNLLGNLRSSGSGLQPPEQFPSRCQRIRRGRLR